jgi:hypothetical protein
MKELKYGWRPLFLFTLAIFAVSSMVLMSLILSILFEYSTISESVGVLVWILIILAISFMYPYFSTKRRRRLLKTGVCCEAQVVEFEYNENIWFYGWRIGYGLSKNYPHPFSLTVSYANGAGNIVLKKSKLLYYNIPFNAERFVAKIWVNPQKAEDTYLQLFLKKEN